MKRRLLFVFSVLLIVAMVLAACAKPTEAPVVPEEPVATDAPVVTEAPAKNPLKITLTFRNVVRGYLATPDKVVQELQAQLAEVGIEVTLEEMETAAFIDATAAGQKGFYTLGWGTDYPDATNYYDYHFNASSNLQFGVIPEDIRLAISAAATSSDPAFRQAQYDIVNQRLKDEIIMIPVSHAGSGTAYQANVEGAHSSPLSNEKFSVVSNGTDTFVWMQNAEPAALWCSDETDGETLRACEQVYESLLGYEIGATDVIPALAESFVANPDATEYVFTLRQGVKFHNGAAFDANDVVASYVAQWDTASPNHIGRTGSFEYFAADFGAFINAESVIAELTETDGLFSMVAPDCSYVPEGVNGFKAIEAVDPFTVKFTICKPDPAFPSKAAFSAFSIQDKDYLDTNGGDSVVMSEAPNGTGPYKVVEWKRGDSIVYEANPEYWGEPAKTKNLIFRWSEQSAQRLLELQAGTVNGIDNPGPDDIPVVEADANLIFVPREGSNTFYIGFNNTIAPFDNPLVRQAISYAIDRQRIVDQYMPEGSVIAVSFVPDSFVPGVSPSIPWFDFDQAKARELLIEAGYTVD